MRPFTIGVSFAAVVAVCLVGPLPEAAAQTTYWWNTTGTGLWSSGANWSSAASGGTSGTAPTTTNHVAVFNQTAVNGDVTAEIGTASTVRGIIFQNSGSTLLRAATSGTQTLTLSVDGLTLAAGAGPVKIGDATNALSIFMSLAHSITNNSSSLLTIANTYDTNTRALVITGTGSGGVRMDGSLIGTGVVTKSGSGALTLAGSNLYSGSTTISGGTLAIAGAGTLGSGTYSISTSAYTSTITNNAALLFEGSANQALGGVISGTGSLTMAGSGMLTLYAANTYSGLTTISSGTLEIGPINASQGSLGVGNVVNNGSLIFNTVRSGTYHGVISGSGGMLKTGHIDNNTSVPCWITLTGSNTFTGPLAIQSGTVNLNFAAGGTAVSNILAPSVRVEVGTNLGAAPNLTQAGGFQRVLPQQMTTLAVTGSAGMVNSQSLTGLTIHDGIGQVAVTTPATGSLTLSVGNVQRSAGSRGIVNVTGTAAGTVAMLTTATNTNGIIGPWAFVTDATGIHWASSGASSGTAGALSAYTGYVTGTWTPGANTNVTSATSAPVNAVTDSLRFNSNVAMTLSGTSTVASGGILFAGGGSITGGGVLRGSPTAGLQITTNNNATISARIADNGGPSPLTFASLNGGLTLSGNNTYTGATTIMGTVTLNSVETGTSGPLGVGGAIEFPGVRTAINTYSPLTLTYGRLNSHDYSTRFTPTVGQAYGVLIPQYQKVTWSGSFGSSISGLNATVNGGDLLLTGSNSFPNGAWLQGTGMGSVTLGSADALGSAGTIWLFAGSSIGGGARLRFTAASAGLDLGSRLSAVSSDWVQLDTNGQNVTFQTRLNLSQNGNALLKQGDGRLTLSGSLNASRLILVGGTLALDSGTVATAWAYNAAAAPLGSYGVSTFQFIGASGTSRAQSVDGLFLQSGLLTVAVNNPGTTTTVNFAGTGASLITRGTATQFGALVGQLGTVDFRSVSGTFGTTAIVRTGTAQALTNGILGPWATVNGTDWATHTSGTIRAYTGYTDVASDTIADGSTANARIASTTTGTVTLGASTVTVNTLLQSATTAARISFPSGTLRTGGIMVGSGAAALTLGDSAGSGTLQPATAGGEVILSNFSTGTMTVSSVIANNTSASRLTVSGNGTVVLTASNTLSGTTALHGGTLRIGDGGTTGSLASNALILAAGATLVFDRSDDYGGAVSFPITSQGFQFGSPGGVVVRGGNLSLSGANTYWGRTLLAGGTTTMAVANALSNRGGDITFTGGVVRYGSGVTDDLSGRIVDSTSPIVIDTNGQSGTWSYTLAASNVGGLTKRGGGTLSLTNVNAFQGTTTIEGGMLAGAAQSFPGDIVNSGTLSFNNDPLGVGGVYAGVISGTGVVVASNTSAFIPTLTGTSTFATVPVIQQGRLDIGWSAAAGQPSPLGTSGTVNVGTTGAGGLLGYSGASDVTFTRTVNLAGTTIGGGLAADGAGAFIVTGLVTATGAGSKTFTLTGSGTAANEVRGVISNNSGSNLTSLAKTGDGVWWVTGTNTFTGSTSITAGTLVVSQLTGTGVAGPLGAATSAIQLGSTTVPATLRYTGTGHSTNRGITLTGTGALEAAGPGAMTVTGTVTGVAGSAVTLLLTGTSMAANAMGMISEAADPAVTSVTKDGPGLWRLTSAASDFSGPFTVKNGTVVAAASAGASGVAGAFGSGGAPIVGDTAAGATGTAALLAEAGVTIRGVKVAAAGAGSTQAVLIGGASTTGTAIFASNPSLALGRNVSLVAATGGAASFANGWLDAAESGIPSVDVAIGAPGYLGAVRLLTSGTLATTGSVAVRYGTAVLGATTILDGAGTVAIDSGATLTGIGTVAAPLGGAGLVAPGNSPGILTAEGFDPALGLAAAFEFSGTAPNYASASNSVNDVLRLTGTTPFTAGLTASNVVSIYLSGSGNLGDVFEGGFFTDSTSAAFTNFQTLVASGNFVGYYQSGTGAYSYNGQNYALLSDLNRQLQVGVTTVPSAGFVSGSSTVINGQVTTFTVVVPEPATLVLAAMGIGLAARSLRRRRATAKKMVPVAKIR